MIGRLLKQLMSGLWIYTASKVAPRGPVEKKRNSTASAAAEPESLQLAFKPHGAFDWQILSEEHGSLYLGGPSSEALDLLVHEPRFIVDVGCSRGDFAALAKQRFPQARVWGIEPNLEAARMAQSRVDRVLSQPIEKIDWRTEGVKQGDIDTVFLFDVLEHTYDPWSVLLQLRNLVSRTGQLIVSIPNVRNVLLIQDLVSGFWRYRRAGLLDITHIRFFTAQDMMRMFYQTGFRVVSSGSFRCEGSSKIYDRYRSGPFPVVVELKSATITVHSLEDLQSLCAVQHMFALQPAEYENLSPAERAWIDDPHPASMAYSPD